MPRFSVITPTWNRADKIARCLNSVMIQSYRDFEFIVVDDGSTIGDTEAIVRSYEGKIPGLKYIKKKHEGRVQARNRGMAEADKGNGAFFWLDSDDSLDAEYLNTFAYNMDENPDAHLFVCGALVHGVKKDKGGNHLCPVWSKIRPAWLPPPSCDGASVLFNSGRVGTGCFSYSREAYEKIGQFPDDWLNHNDIADGIDSWLGLAPGSTGYGSSTRLVGNPHGCDHAYFQHLCLYYRVYLIDVALYCQYVR